MSSSFEIRAVILLSGLCSDTWATMHMLKEIIGGAVKASDGTRANAFFRMIANRCGYLNDGDAAMPNESL